MSSFKRKWSNPRRSTSLVVISARHDLVLVEGKRLAAVAGPPYALDGAGAARVEGDHLALGRLTVHTDVVGRLLDETVGLAGYDVGILGQSDVKGLPGAAQRQMKLVRAIGWPTRRWPRSLRSETRCP